MKTVKVIVLDPEIPAYVIRHIQRLLRKALRRRSLPIVRVPVTESLRATATAPAAEASR